MQLMRGQAVSATTWAKLAFALSAISLAVSLAGVTPVEAVKSVKRSLFANNAGAVDGISASRTPKPGRLLALDAQGRFPGSVLPGAGAAGARGPRGPEGPTGPRGPASAFITHPAASVGLPRAKWVFVPVASLALPAGKWLFDYSAVASWFDPGGLIVNCRLRVDGKELSAKHGVVGGSAGSTRQLVLAGNGAIDKPTAFNAVLECTADQDVLPDSRPQVSVTLPELSAVQVTELDVQ
ncbi:MAG: hypothetical protein DYH12_30640 [Sorangiineae bacterium PRO1]|nr:hypothetical protein [Sorangiineae bacterium PRO1]